MNDDAVEVRRSVNLALAPFPHHGALGAGPPAGTTAAECVRGSAKTLVVARTDDTWVELGELATAFSAASAPLAWIEHGTVGVFQA